MFVEHVIKSGSAHSAFYLFSGEDTLNEMFELGFLVGRLGSEKIFCIHPHQTPFPASIPGLHNKEIVVKLEEISLSLIKELKAAGYTVSI
jgi:predicted nucleotide-binding protein